ncbi:MAG: hypothetical protein SOU82_08360, partial [Alloprevotella sp.]|nr:hypothetical protein [Alloprevotella sp.]
TPPLNKLFGKARAAAGRLSIINALIAPICSIFRQDWRHLGHNKSKSEGFRLLLHLVCSIFA